MLAVSAKPLFPGQSCQRSSLGLSWVTGHPSSCDSSHTHSCPLRVPGCTGQRSTQLAESGTFSQLPKRRSWVALRLGCHWVLLSPQTWVQPHSAVLARKQEDSCGRRGLSVSQCPCLPCYSCHFKRCGDSRSWGVLQWAGSSLPSPAHLQKGDACVGCGLP